MQLEDIDFKLEHEHGTVRLSELTDEDMNQIKKITATIIQEKIFDEPYKAILAAFFVYTESLIACNEWLSEGGRHH